MIYYGFMLLSHKPKIFAANHKTEGLLVMTQQFIILTICNNFLFGIFASSNNFAYFSCCQTYAGVGGAVIYA